MAAVPVEKYKYVPYSATQQPLPSNTSVSPPANGTSSPSPSPNSHIAPKPKPKQRMNYQPVELTETPSADESTNSISQVSSRKLPPPVPKKPKNVPSKKPPAPLPSRAVPSSDFSANRIEKPPMLLPPDVTDSADSAQESIPPTPTAEVVGKKVSPQTLPRPKTSATAPHSERERRNTESDIQSLKQPPELPDRIANCFTKKSSSLDSEVGPTLLQPPRKNSQSALTPADLDWHPTGETMTLSGLADTHSSRFPLKIHLLDGYYGQTARFTLSSSDMFDIHYSKRTQVVSVRDSLGTDYSIPLNSAIQFGIVYNMVTSKSQPPPQTAFGTVQDLLSLDHLPNVVCATASWGKPGTKEGKMSVEEGEILFLKGVYKPKLRNKRALKCYSLKTQGRKLLPEECEGNFSVDPRDTKLHVFEFASKLKGVFPCKAMMFLYQGSSFDSPVFRNVPKSLFKKPISVIKVTTEISLTATSVVKPTPPPRGDRDKSPSDQEDSTVTPKKPLPIEIPLDSHLADIEVEILEAPNEDETEKLYMNTQEVLKKMNKEPYMILLDKGSDSINDTQSLFYMQVRKDKPDIGVAYVTSQAIRDRLDAQPYSTANVPNSASKKLTHGDKLPATIMEDEGNASDSSDEHMYEPIDDDVWGRKLSSPAIQQLSPQNIPHFPPTHPQTKYPSPHNPIPFSPSQVSPLHAQGHFSLSGHMVEEQYDIPTTSPSFTLSPPQTQTMVSPPTMFQPLQVPPAFQGNPYVHMIPTASVEESPSTPVAPSTVAANKTFLKAMSVADVSGFICKLVGSYVCLLQQ